MAKEIIFYNLKKGVKEEDYEKWCKEYKGPFFVSLGACRSFTLVRMLGGVKGDGSSNIPPSETGLPFKYIGIADVRSLEEWRKDTESKRFKMDFFAQWFSNWVADFYILAGEEVYEGKAG